MNFDGTLLIIGRLADFIAGSSAKFIKSDCLLWEEWFFAAGEFIIHSSHAAGSRINDGAMFGTLLQRI